MNCAAITSEDVFALAQWFSLMTVALTVLGCCVFKLIECAAEAIINVVRKRGAAAPFAARAVAFERLAQRWATTFERIAERNRREAARLESQ